MYKFDTEWFDDLIWCPSQLERHYTNTKTGVQWTLYCRWRHDDPWTFATFPTQNNRYDQWKELGSGLTRDTPISVVHTYAEELLKHHYLWRSIQDEVT